MIPLPRAWLLTSALLVGAAVGLIVGVVSILVVDTAIRPDVVIALVVGVPGLLGILTVALSGRRWVTTVGAFILAIAPGWFGVFVAIQAVHGA